MTSESHLRSIPSVEQLLSSGVFDNHIENLSRPLVTSVIRDTLQLIRESVAKAGEVTTAEEIKVRIENALTLLAKQRIQRVINGTGVLIHTNLGRAPLGAELLERVARRVKGYSTLEFDLATGKRGKRGSFLSYLIAQLTETEAALVVNNNAAALFLILNTLANKKEVIVSRSELVQIGGGFRIPDIIRKAGAKLVEVGTTNQTNQSDYSGAIGKKTAMLLKVHRSNFELEGFVEEVAPNEIAKIANEHQLFSVFDLGSGSYHRTEEFGMASEPNITSAVRSGCTVVSFSGDKLFGSVQAGIILGSQKLVEMLYRNPIFRALRPDKISLAILEESAFAYLQKRDKELLPLWKMIAIQPDELSRRAEIIRSSISSTKLSVEIRSAYSTLGGGSLPGSKLESIALSIRPEMKLTKFNRLLLDASPPLIGYIENEALILDLRTIDESEDADVIRILKEIAECTP